MEELQEITGKGFQDPLHLSTMAGVDLKGLLHPKWFCDHSLH